MRKLYTLAFPALSGEDSYWIEAFRREHDPHHALVAAHFTILFGCTDVAEDEYLRHVETATRGFQAVRFCCRYAMPGSDGERGLVYLVPDEGFSGLSRLHDQLCSGPVADQRRLETTFLPHITIGASVDRLAVRTWCDQLNMQGLSIDGGINAVTVIGIEGEKVRTLGTFNLLEDGLEA